MFSYIKKQQVHISSRPHSLAVKVVIVIVVVSIASARGAATALVGKTEVGSEAAELLHCLRTSRTS